MTLKCHPDSVLYPHFLGRRLNLIGLSDRFSIWSFSFGVFIFCKRSVGIKIKGNNVEMSNTIKRKRK